MGNWAQQPPSEDGWTPDWDQTKTDVGKFEKRGSSTDQDHDFQTWATTHISDLLCDSMKLW